jgi:hypothetical protein
MASTTAATLRGEFDEKLVELCDRIGTANDSARTTLEMNNLALVELESCVRILETRPPTDDISTSLCTEMDDLRCDVTREIHSALASAGTTSEAARVRVLESRPPAAPATNTSLPCDNPLRDGNSPAQPHGDPPPARPRVDNAFSPGVCFAPDGLTVEEHARNAWADSPSGRGAGAHVPAPRSHLFSDISQHPPQTATPPRDTPANPSAHPQTATPPQYIPVASHDSTTTPGGPIVSPRQGDREGQARRLGASRFDIVRLATPDYHIGTHGVAMLTHAILVKCGYNQIASSDVVTCHNDIIAVHRRVWELWYNPSSHTYGPQVERIVTKSLKLLPTLDLAATETMVDFYDRLQESASGLAIAIMPFDTVMIRYGLKGLCVPGLGMDKYHVMSKALMELLPRLISGNLSPQINAALA